MSKVPVDLNYILGYIDEEKITRKELASRVGIAYDTLNRTLKGGTCSPGTAQSLKAYLGPEALREDPGDPYGIILRFRQAESAGNLYRLREYRGMYQVGIDHPNGKFLVRHSSSDPIFAEKKMKEFNSNKRMTS